MAIAVALVSCKKEEQIVPEIKADKTEVTVPTAGTEDEDVFIEFESNVEWTAALKEAIDWGSITPAKGVAGKGKIKIIADANQGNDARTVVVVVTAGAAQKEFTVTQLQKDAFSLVAESAEVGAEGGEVEIKVMTNIAYEVVLPDGASWVKLATTKAYGEQVTKVTVEAFDELDGEREAVLAVKAAGFEAQEFTITQNGPQTKKWSVDMHNVMNRVSSYTPAGEEVAGTAVSLAVWGDKLVVCAGDGSKPVLLDKTTGEKKGELDTGSAKAMYVTNDDAGNLVFCNRVYNYWTSYAFFTIWYMKPGDSTPTKLVSTADSEYYPSYIGAGLNVRGDVTKDAAIAAPWEGVLGVSGENMVLAWNVKGGVAQPYVKITVVDFPGISWWGGYWCEMPTHFPGFALTGNDIAKGAVASVYDTNTICYIGADCKSTAIQKISVPYTDESGKVIDASGNYNSGCLDYRSINGKDYFVCALSSFYNSAIIGVYDVATKELVYSPEISNYSVADDPKEPINGLVSTAAAVRLQQVSDGFELYHINNSCSAIEAFWCPLK